MTLAKWTRILIILVPCFVLPAPHSIVADEVLFIKELEQRRQQILSRIEELKALKLQSEQSLARGKRVHDKAISMNDEASGHVAAQAISKATNALGEIRKELREKQGNLVRINHFLDQKEKISVSNLKTRILVRKVPNPMQMPLGSWLRYVHSDRAGLIMDAIEKGNGDLDRAIKHLDEQVIRYGGNRNSESALSYLEGLRTSYIAADVEYRKQDKGQGEPIDIYSKTLMDAIERDNGAYKWPGPKNPDPGAKPLNPLDWRIQRAEKMLSALKDTPNDLGKTYQTLQDDKDIFAAANAKHYLQGAVAYWDFLDTTGAK